MNFISRYSFQIFSAGVIIIGIYQTWILRWLCDDAFISFVYARNLSDGLGLVFQTGEYVEGFSNFLWTLIISFFIFLKFSPLDTSITIGIFFYLLLLFYFYRTERKLRPYSNLPLFLIHFCLFFHGWVFATSGLETMMFTCFLSIGLIRWSEKETNVGYILLLAALTRPEGILFLFLYTISDWHKFKSWKKLIPLLVYMFFLIFRYFYYGDLLPNTFYAKADKPAYFIQGFYYLLFLLRTYPLYGFILIYAIYLNLFQIFKGPNKLLSIAVLCYIFYVIYIGGDFMGIRFWFPLIPFLSWLVYLKLVEKMDELQISSNLNSKLNQILQRNLFLIQLIFILSLALYLDPFSHSNRGEYLWHQIGEERRFYNDSLLRENGYDKEALKEFRIAFFGAQAHFVYHMKPIYALEAESGLTDREFAKAVELNPRGRVGHERLADINFLLKKKIELVFSDRYPDLNLPFVIYKFRDFDWKIFVLDYNPFKFKNLCKRKNWDCNPLFQAINTRKLDIEKNQKFWIE